MWDTPSPISRVFDGAGGKDRRSAETFWVETASALIMRRIVPSFVILLTTGIAPAFAQDTPRLSTAPAASNGTAIAVRAREADAASPDARAVMQKAVEKDIINWQAAKDYTFLQRTQENELDGNGKVKSRKSETAEILVLYGEPFERIVAKDDQPLSAAEQKKQNEKFDKDTHKRANESAEDRQKRLEKYQKQREDERGFVREILDAYDFMLVGSEWLNGRETWVIDGAPRAGFEGKRRESKLLRKIKPRFWIDQQDYSWVKLRAEVIDTLTIGWVVARLHKGSTFEMQQVLVNGELWLPQRFDVKLDARVALLKGVNEDVHVTYSDYRKFRTDTKITLAEPAAVE